MAGSLLAGLVCLAVLARAQLSPPRLEAEEPGLATEDGQLLVALPIINLGGTQDSHVQVFSIDLAGQSLLKPRSLPLSLGDIPVGKTVVLQLAFDRTGLVADKQYSLRLEGTSLVSGRPRRFQVQQPISLPEPDEGSRDVFRGQVAPQDVSVGRNPPPRGGAELEDINEGTGPPLPEGEVIEEDGAEDLPTEFTIARPFTRAPSKQLLKTDQAANEPVAFIRAATQAMPGTGVPWDPSGGSVDVSSIGPPGTGGLLARLVFLSGNLYLLFSTDGGANFTAISPTALFPAASIPADGLPPDQGMVGDQNLLYIPKIDRFVWIMLTKGSQVGVVTQPNPNPPPATQQVPIFAGNRLRIAAASPADLIKYGGQLPAWKVWDLTTKTLGFVTGKPFLDYPDLSFTEENLLISAQRSDIGAIFVTRIPLNDIKNGGGINISRTGLHKSAFGGRLAHDSPDAAYWFGHAATNKLRIFEWLDGAPVYSWWTLKVASWTPIAGNNPAGYQSITPGGSNDWLAKNAGAVRGATFQSSFTEQVDGSTVVARRLVVAWNAARDGKFPQPYVRIQPVVKRSFGQLSLWSKEKSRKIYHPTVAFHHAHLATNANGEIGISLAAGGGGNEASPLAGFLGETLYLINISTASINIWGDYTAIRPHWPNTKLFSVSDYFLVSPAGTPGSITPIHQYRLFGRVADIGSTF